MEINKCFYCMEDMPYQSQVCPHCGKRVGEKVQPEFALHPGNILGGRYLIGGMLGQGGFGITYIGYDLLLSSKVAIKEYYPMSIANRSISGSVLWSENGVPKEQGCNNFLKEARKMEKLKGIPEVVNISNILMENNTAYIVMDFIEGITLKTKLERDGAMTSDAAIALLSPVIRALSQVHTHGIIHRDISPDNIMINPEGKAVLLDLGAAKELDMSAGQDKQSSVLTHKDGFSPVEQYAQGSDIGPWTDVYAMCATLYYAITGNMVPSAIDRMVVKWSGEFTENVPKNLRAVLLKGLSMDTKQRYQNMNELLAALGEKSEKKIKSNGKTKSDNKPSAKNPVKAVIAAGAVAACVALAVLVTQIFIPAGRYKAAVALKESGKYTEAIEAFEAMNGYKDSDKQITACREAILSAVEQLTNVAPATEESDESAPSENSGSETPGIHDLQALGLEEKMDLPSDKDYLSNYRTMYVSTWKAEVYSYISAENAVCIGSLSNGTEVTAIAQGRTMTCVLYDTVDGKMAGWVTSSNLTT